MWMVVAGVWAGGGEEVGYLFPPPGRLQRGMGYEPYEDIHMR